MLKPIRLLIDLFIDTKKLGDKTDAFEMASTKKHNKFLSNLLTKKSEESTPANACEFLPFINNMHFNLVRNHIQMNPWNYAYHFNWMTF